MQMQVRLMVIPTMLWPWGRWKRNRPDLDPRLRSRIACMTGPDTKKSALANHIAPANIKTNLMRAGLYLAAYELLRGEIVEQVRNFFVLPGELATESYDKHVPPK